jgi:hypothetical protein
MDANDPARAGCAQQQTSREHRRHPRNSMLLQAMLRLENSCQTLKFRVRNLSATGLMGEAPLDLAPGTVVSVELRNVGTVPATVAWSLEGRFGLAFLETIDPALVRQLPPPDVPTGPLHTETSDLVVRRPLVIGKAPPREPVAAPSRFV